MYSLDLFFLIIGNNEIVSFNAAPCCPTLSYDLRIVLILVYLYASLRN